MKNFAIRLKMARTMQGWSMQQLADHMDGSITKQAIGKYEKGSMQPNESTFHALCRVLKVRPDFFHRDEEIIINPSFRKRKKLSKTLERSIVERTRDFLERYLETEELLAIDSTFHMPAMDNSCKSLSDAEKVAEAFRQAMNLGTDPIYNIIELMEDWGIKVYHESFSTHSISGLSSTVGDGLHIIVINKDLTVDHQRFTAMHELGHIIMDFPEGLEENDIEKMCNRFAGAMLIPAEVLRRELGPHRSRIMLKELVLINAQYGVSPQALIYRAKDLNIITTHVYTSMMKDISIRFGRGADIGQYKGKEESNRHFQLLCRGIAQEAFTSSKAASLYNKTLSSFRKEVMSIETND